MDCYKLVDGKRMPWFLEFDSQGTIINEDDFNNLSGMIRKYKGKKAPEWDKIPEGKKEFKIPQEFSSALTADKEAKMFFDNLSPSRQKQFVGWIASAKKSETRDRRTKEALKLLGEKQKLGMK